MNRDTVVANWLLLRTWRRKKVNRRLRTHLAGSVTMDEIEEILMETLVLQEQAGNDLDTIAMHLAGDPPPETEEFTEEFGLGRAIAVEVLYRVAVRLTKR